MSVAALPTSEKLFYRATLVQTRLQNAANFVTPKLLARFEGCECSVGAYPDIDEDCRKLGKRTCEFSETYCPEILWTTAGCGPWWLSPCDGHCVGIIGGGKP